MANQPDKEDRSHRTGDLEAERCRRQIEHWARIRPDPGNALDPSDLTVISHVLAGEAAFNGLSASMSPIGERLESWGLLRSDDGARRRSFETTAAGRKALQTGRMPE